jgi:hypothetical protein
MTRIRRINVSQVEGDSANTTNTSEIRPYGEMAVYVGNNNKLELLMFDGVRTHVRSKVLSKGTFYGGDADSGDGNGLDTIKLIPDAEILYNDSSDHRYLIIDPTVTNHIHIRAGGPIDNSDALLILGGEENNVMVSDVDDQVTIRTNDTHTWQFGSDGSITFPDNTIQTTAYPGNNPNVWVQDFETSLGAPTDVPGNAIAVEYLANGDIVALINHYTVSNDRYNSIARFDSTGTQVWSISFQGGQLTDGWGLAVDNVNEFIYVAGKVDSDIAAYEVATLTKLSQTDGNVVWSKAYDVGYDNTNTVVDVASDGSPVVVGYADVAVDDEQVVTTKINKDDGSVTWSRALNGQNGEFAWGMAVGPTDEVVSVGYMSQLGITDAVATLYTEPASNPNWTTGASIYYGNFTARVDFTDGVPTFTNIVDPEGNRTVDGTVATISGASFGGTSPADDMILKVGTLVANEPDDRMLVVKYDSTGSIQWQKAVQVEVGFNCSGADADIDSTGNIYVCGNYYYDGADPFIDNSAMIIIKFNSLGVKQWTRKVIGPCEDFATSIVVGPDDYLYLLGLTGNDNQDDYSMVIAKYNLDGTVVWQRLLDNTTTWTFAGGLWFGPSGGTGSNLAVKNGYVAVAGGYGDPGPTVPHAVVAQVTSDGTLFTAGNYDFKAATFSGLLDSSASNITVVNAGKTDSNYAGSFTITDFDPDYDPTSDLIGTLYTQGSFGSINSIDNGIYSVGVDVDGVVTMSTSRGTVEFGALPEPGGTTHFHIMKGAGQDGSGGMDLYFGDDFNYVLQRADSYNGSPAYGVEIGAQDLGGGGSQQVWRFGTDGDLTIPGNIKSTTDASIVVGSTYSPVTGVNVQTVDELVPPGGVWRIFISATTYSSLGTTVQVGDTVTTTWGTPVTATIIDVLQLDGTWRFHVAQNIVTGFSAGDTVTFNPVSETWTFAADGNLTTPQTSSIFALGTDFTGTIVGGTSPTAGYIRVESNTGAPNFTPAPISTAFYNFLSTLTAGAEFTVSTVVDGTTYNTVVSFTEFAGGNPVDTDRNDLYWTKVSGDTLPFSYSASALTLTFINNSTVITPTGITFPDATVQTTAYIPGGSSIATGVSRSDDNLIIRLTDPNDDGLELRSLVVDGDDADVASTVLGPNGFIIRTNSNVSQQQWQFGNDGGITFPDGDIQTTAYVAPTTGNFVVSSQDSGTFIIRNGMTIGITAAGVLQMTFDSVINIKGRTATNGGASTVIAAPNGATTIGVAYPISGALAADDHVVVTVADASFHNVYRITAVIRDQDATPGNELTTAYVIIEQIQ